nr:hypothetical protein [Chromobacterium sp. ASV5]
MREFIECRHGGLRRRALWGAALIAAGGLLLSSRAGWLPALALPAWAGDIRDYGVWHLLAGLAALSGLSHLVCADGPRRAAKGALRLALGAWIFICLQHIWGWSFASSWPVLLILWGAGMLARGLWPKNASVWRA